MSLCLFKRIQRKVPIFILAICLTACSNSSEGNHEIIESSLKESVIETAILGLVENDNIRIPLQCQWRAEDRPFDGNNTVYYKSYYDDFVRGSTIGFKFPDINLQENIAEYFVADENEIGFDQMDKIVEMFFDNRTIEMDEKSLKDLFNEYGYEVCFYSELIDALQVRFIEIRESDGLSLYPSRILIQSWDKEHIYLQDITGATPRRIRSFITITDGVAPQLIVHSSGFSKDYVSEEELSFWIYRGSYWILTSMDLNIDSSHAHSANDLYPDIERDTLFEPVYYPDGIVYRTSIQDDGLNTYPYRLGKMEEIEKNKSFRLIAILNSPRKTIEKSNCYIEFEIN